MLSEAEKKVWGCPELLERLLVFLDPDSLVSLAEAHEPANSVLGKTLWNKLVKQVCQGSGRSSSRECASYKDLMLKRMKVVDLVEILKSKEDPWDAFRDLLKEICKSFPAENSSLARLSFPWDDSDVVSVSLDGFCLLEAAEGAMDSTEQNLKLIVVDLLSSHLLTAVGSRLARQQTSAADLVVRFPNSLCCHRGSANLTTDVDTRLVVRSKIQCLGEECISAINSILQHCGKVDLHGPLEVDRDIRREGWAGLRQALSWRLHDIPHLDTGFKSYVTSARREDLRAIWECISLSWKFSGVFRGGDLLELEFEKQMGDKGLAALERFVDLTNEEWAARKKARLAIQTEHLSLNGHPIQLPFENAALQPIVLKIGEVQVEVKMQEPGIRGLNKALQQLMLFHPAFGPQSELDQGEERQEEVRHVEDVEGERQGCLASLFCLKAMRKEEDEED